jgi:hypothetical protein
MTRKGWIIAIGFAILANVLVLAAAAMNRSGAPEAALRLTERELPIHFRAEEDTGIYLWLRANHVGVEPWLDREKLEALGFDCSPPITAEAVEFHYDRLLPREAFVVLEYEGEAWAAWLEKQKQELDESAEQVRLGERTAEYLEKEHERQAKRRREASRLFVVDAGPDAAALRSEYPDRSGFLIVPAVFAVEVGRDYDDDGETWEAGALRGRISEILVSTIHVGRAHRAPFESMPLPQSLAAGGPIGPRYAVTLTFGRRYEPWVTRVEKLAVSGQPGSDSR